MRLGATANETASAATGFESRFFPKAQFFPKAHFTTLMAPTLYPACRQQACCPGCARRFLACPPRRHRVSQKRDPAGRDGPHICPIMGALGVGRCSAGADDRGISGTSCGGGATDYLLRGAGGRVFWLSPFTDRICGRLRLLLSNFPTHRSHHEQRAAHQSAIERRRSHLWAR